jgi:hypothetical protein
LVSWCSIFTQQKGTITAIFFVLLWCCAGSIVGFAVPVAANDGQDRQHLAMDVHGMSGGKGLSSALWCTPSATASHKMPRPLPHTLPHNPPHVMPPLPLPSASSRDEEEKEVMRKDWGGGEWRGYKAAVIRKAAPAHPFLPTCEHRHPPPPPPRPPTPRP